MIKISYKNIIFDLDSTLVKIEGLDELARKKDKYEEVSRLTKLSMEGKIDFQKSMIRKMKIISPSKKDLEWLGRLYIKSLVYGSKKLIQTLKYHGKDIFLITGNFKPAVIPLANDIGISEKNVYCNDIFFDSLGKYKSFTSGNYLSRNGGKSKLIKSLNLKGRSCLIGDGSTDVEARDVVDIFVGFGGVVERKNVKENADFYISKMKQLLPILDENSTFFRYHDTYHDIRG